MLFKSTIVAALAASVIAVDPLHKHHVHEQKREATVYVTAPATESVLPTTLLTVPVASASASGSASASASGSSAAPSASAGASGSSVAVGASGAFGITYSPYSADGGCKSSSQIASEIAQISGYSVIRLYGVDCDQVSAVLKAKTSSQKIFAGIYYVDKIADSVSTLASAVASSGSWSDIYTVSVGNELVNNGEATTSQIQGYVQTAKSALKSAGYTGPVVSVDTFIATINNPALCEYSDYIAINAHCFFDGYYAAAEAGTWLLDQIQRVSTACGNSKKVLVVESGWPSKGDSNNKAIPSKANQEAAISSIISTCGDDTIVFNAFNDLWKADGSYNAEKYWGILSS